MEFKRQVLTLTWDAPLLKTQARDVRKALIKYLSSSGEDELAEYASNKFSGNRSYTITYAINNMGECVLYDYNDNGNLKRMHQLVSDSEKDFRFGKSDLVGSNYFEEDMGELGVKKDKTFIYASKTPYLMYNTKNFKKMLSLREEGEYKALEEMQKRIFRNHILAFFSSKLGVTLEEEVIVEDLKIADRYAINVKEGLKFEGYWIIGAKVNVKLPEIFSIGRHSSKNFGTFIKLL